MITLSDYLDYLNNEIIQARKKADEKSVEVAKEYAKHEYLKYFRAPRYAFPSIKMDIPVKITDIDSLSKYNFKLDEDALLIDINERIRKTNVEKKLTIPLFKKEQLQAKEFKQLFSTLEKKDQRLVKSLEEEIKKIDLSIPLKSLHKRTFRPQDGSSEAEMSELNRILKEAIGRGHSLVSTQLNEILIGPNTAGAEDKDKVFVNLHIEMEEQGIRIARFTDRNGQEIEEIIFE